MWRRAALAARRSLSTAPPAVAARQQKASAKVEPPSKAQLWRLALANGVPFVGFGFADNVIMILAGDAIDKSIGVTLGISTLAAAGFGNLLSDVVGIGAGDVIDRYSEKIIGKPKTKALSLEQLALRSCRIVKTWATIIGITVGCLLGMAPLLFLGEKKELYFTKEEMALYESALRPYGVSPDNFFAMMRARGVPLTPSTRVVSRISRPFDAPRRRKSNWRTLQPGEALVRAGESMDRIVLVATGSVDSYETAPDGSLKRLYRYRAKRDIARPQDSTVNSFQVPIRGCVIGGTALLDPSVRAQPYPSTALAAEPARVVEFSYGALRSAMDENPAIEAAILNVLYFDLVEGLRRRGQYDYAAKEAARKATGGPVAPRKLPTIMQEDVRVTMYELIMRVALADGVVHSAEREFLAKYQMENAITDEEHIASLAANGWTAAQWDAGVQEGQLEGGTAAIKSAIPDLLTQAGIKSRLTTDRGKEKK
jgi:CRP-like cAMP-binding protein